MGKRNILCAFVAGLIMASCGNNNMNSKETGDNQKVVKQRADGTISLALSNADFYSDMNNPSCNLAEWDIAVSRSGKYNVWLASMTKDTNDLRYKNSVMISVEEDKLIGHPEPDRILYNSSDVSYPWFKAESFMGAVFIKDTGVYHVQVNSEQIVPTDIKTGNLSGEELSKLVSISFTPEKR